ncbi:hypothetical protein BH23CHL1_BH23CHL1_10640 [soil metagenome]
MSDDNIQSGPARDDMYQSMAIKLVNSGVLTPVAEFVKDVRAVAGFRASPRQITAALDGLSDSGESIDVASVAAVVGKSRGDRSQRQRRNAREWNALGAALTLQGLDGTPEGQREFLGITRQVAGSHANDSLLLQLSLILAGDGIELSPRTVGLIGKRLAKSAADLTDLQLADHALREYASLNRPQPTLRQQRKTSVAARRTGPIEYQNKPGKRRWKPGGRRRLTIQFPKKPDDDR